MNYTDLSYINEITMGDQDALNELIEMFIGQVDEFKANLNLFLTGKDWDHLGKEAHKAKSSVAIFGMEELSHALKELQLLTEKEEKVETYGEFVSMFESQCDAAVIELKSHLKK